MQQLMTRLKLARVRDVYETWLERAAQEGPVSYTHLTLPTILRV